jgi:hypothetical protein
MLVYHLPERASRRREVVEFRAQIEAGTREWVAQIWRDDVEAKQAARQGRGEKERTQ